MEQSGTSTILETSGTSFALNLTAIANGTGFNDREGLQLGVRKVTGTLLLHSLNAGDAVQNQQFVRVVIFRDKQQISDTVPTYDSVMTDMTVPASYNPDVAGRYQVMYDRIFKVDLAGSNASQVARITIPFRMPLKVRYNGTASTDIQKNGLYVGVTGSGLADIDSGSVQMDWRFTTYYIDN